MGKTIYITEEIFKNINANYKLPKFIMKKLDQNAFLGDNGALPIGDDKPYVYKLLKKRFVDVTNALIGKYESMDVDYLSAKLSESFKECRELEKPIRSNLEKVCFNTVVKMFNVPKDTLNVKCELVEKIQPRYGGVRIEPESNDIIQYEYEDTKDIDALSLECLKRRMINALIQGSSNVYGNNTSEYLVEIYKLNPRLITLYDEINLINDYLLFTKEDKITDNNIQQGSYVEVIIGTNNKKTSIVSQGLILPFLIKDTIRGFMELFASHGLPKDNKKAMYIIRQSDFLLAEPWDLRVGVELWKDIYDYDETNILPYFFKNLSSLDVDSFNDGVSNILAHTKKGKKVFEYLLKKSVKEYEDNQFAERIKIKNDDSALINDSYFNDEELSDMLLSDEVYF